MKLLKFLLTLCLLPTFAVAQSFPVKRNDNATTTIQNTNLQPSVLSTNSKGQLFTPVDPSSNVSPSTIPLSLATTMAGPPVGMVAWARVTSSTTATGGSTTSITVASHTAAVGDLIQMITGTAANIQAWSDVTAVTGTTITLGHALPSAVANNDTFRIYKPSPLLATDGVNTLGSALFVTIDSNYEATRAQGLLKNLSTDSWASGNAAVIVGAYREAIPSTTGVGATDGAYSTLKTDPNGAIYTHGIAGSSGGYSKYSFGALVGTVQTVQGTATNMGGYEILNSAATICYLQMFDAATATSITLGTTVPDLSLGFPAGAAANIPASNPGIGFTNGLKIAATTTRAGSTPCGTGMDVNIFYK